MIMHNGRQSLNTWLRTVVPAIGLNFQADIDIVAKAISTNLLLTCVPYKFLKFTC